MTPKEVNKKYSAISTDKSEAVMLDGAKLRRNKVDKNLLELPSDYGDWLVSLKQRIRSDRQRALLAINQE